MNKVLRAAVVLAFAVVSTRPLSSFAAVSTLTTGESDAMPDDCKSPYPDIGGFLAFYENTISMIVAKRGATTKGAAELFAVSELRSEVDARVPNPSGESAIDRLVISQLCQYRDIYAAENPSNGPGKRVIVESKNEGLQEHLVKIAPKLYKDSRDYAQTVFAEIARSRHKNDLIEKKREDIKRARAMGHQRIEDILVD